jgi:hypothetical protein
MLTARSRGEYLREVGWFLGIFPSLFTIVASRIRRRKKEKRCESIAKKSKKHKKKKHKKKKLSNLKQEKRKRYDSPGEKTL